MAMLTPAELLRIVGLRPELRAAVLPIMNAVEQATGKKVTVPPHGGLRTYAQQAALKANEGSNPYPVAAPGSSYHEYGAALDLDIIGGTDADYQLMSSIVSGTFGLVSGYPSDLVHMRLNESLAESAATWQQLQTQRFTIAGAAVVLAVVLLAAQPSRRSR